VAPFLYEENKMDYPANTTVVTQSRPFTINGKNVTEITLCEPTVRDKLMYEKSARGTMEKELLMIASQCGLYQADLLLPGYEDPDGAAAPDEVGLNQHVQPDKAHGSRGTLLLQC
jgi:hypothetical protein